MKQILKPETSKKLIATITNLEVTMNSKFNKQVDKVKITFEELKKMYM